MAGVVVSNELVEVCESYEARDVASITGVVVHRVSVAERAAGYSNTPADILRLFVEHTMGREISGGKMPYHLLIDPDGRVTQCVPLGRITPHAREHGRSMVSVACLGDFRDREPTTEQKRSLVAVATHVLDRCSLDATKLYAHDELPEGSRDPDCECPGHALNMAGLRDVVAGALVREHRGGLTLTC